MSAASWAADLPPRLLPPVGQALAACAFEVVRRPLPYAMPVLVSDDGPIARPEATHPVFGAGYDWHSSVHMHWSLLRLDRLGLAGELAGPIAAWFEQRFTAEALERERAHLEAHPRFERPYGWAWFWMLAAEAMAWRAARQPGARWPDRLAPIAKLLADRAQQAWRAASPQRCGFHPNSAFALLLARHAAPALGLDALVDTVDAAARRWYIADRACPASYEPGWNDFLSPGLVEAALMADVLDADEGRPWWRRFRPRDLAPWREPAGGFDRLDAQAVHLDGLNLSRAWCWRRLGRAGWVRRSDAEAAAKAHWQASAAQVTAGDYVATHWLVSFALLALGDLGGEGFAAAADRPQARGQRAVRG